MLAYAIHDLTKRYPGQTTPANDRISLEIAQGEVFGLLGDNGAGKTTLIKQMVNLLAPTSGRILLFGRPLDADPLYTPRHIGYMPQSGLALNSVTVAETLYFTAHLRGLSRRDARAERDRLIAAWDLGAMRDRVGNRLSGGQQRLVLLATTLAARPPVVLLDEPTNDLDPQRRQLVWESLRAINQTHGTTVVLVTHNVVEAEKVVQRVGIMRAGRLVAVGRPGALKAGLNEHLRLEIVFTPEQPPALPDGATPRAVGPGRWQMLITRDAAAGYLEALNCAPGVEDFRLSTATLEDLYLALAEPSANGGAGA
jgi:ABC-type multidrug transport system ATPase subunit